MSAREVAIERAMRSLLRGVDGPEVITPGPVAHLIAPHVREIVERAKAANPGAAVGMEAWGRSIEVAALAYRTSVTAAGGAVDGNPVERGGPGSHGGTGQRVLAVPEAARRLGLSDRATRLLGPALGRKVGRQWVFDLDVIEAERARRAAA